ncbi:hypothetical protein DIU31_010210 [Mucilaginibacter rubeus]|uniref:DUF4476 domain-containing protein n=2 Tax=Mucilaginibacter TaxID=423349 RepID=A0AAE6JDY9_9SPHI|nr:MULTISPECIES: hypothetical protein [Mucilaginibacter]QEM03867.1 hypothetical protein DIU31_010210 [Mucilaginibacter rubeus]QEM16478.1 hypothetical protein DIU38_010310 [Mucilaginibacter gossypii]QTE40755.1 hypothetical protein J3L19_17435 [Mucilaginibacter rubeus]QTE47357.1 hypothetical protein J3L21_17410 [Mucilaginibacter rubeus]QTE58750.1 hypothetical protein J3L23_09085 [Mucilaginibacter rubeus]
MKKPILTIITFFIVAVQALAQNITTPNVEQKDDQSTIIKKIETNSQYTIVTFENYAYQDNAWLQLNKEIFIQTDLSNAHYEYVKSENIAMVPNKNVLKKAGDKLEFKVYFKKIPSAAKSIDIIEHAGLSRPGINYFNFYNVSLTEQAAATNHVKVTDVVLLPPPPVAADTASTGLFNGSPSNYMQNAMNSMGPMYASMAKSVLDAQLAYFKQPGKIAEIAKLNKDYFDALVKVGFNYEQALKIITANGLISKSSSVTGQ